MKIFIAFACLLALTYANENANVLRNEAEVNVESFKYAYELDNSVKAQQEGHLEGPESLKVGGSYEWVSPEGEKVSLQYVADENGFRPLNANPALPTPPPIPEYILRSIEYINSHPSKE